jgi:hypothetical protein
MTLVFLVIIIDPRLVEFSRQFDFSLFRQLMVPHEPVLMPNQARHKDVEHGKYDQCCSVRVREAVEPIDNKESLPLPPSSS